MLLTMMRTRIGSKRLSPNAAILVVFDRWISTFALHFFAEVEDVGDDLYKLVQHIGDYWAIGAADGSGEELDEGVFTNALVVVAIS